MKTTFDIPDSVYREFKVKTTTNDETMRSALLMFVCAYNRIGRNPLAVQSDPEAGRRARSARAGLPPWAGLAAPYLTRRPAASSDSEAQRDAIVAARRKGLS